ncbi:MAG TPA: mechanosensitive ion channel family protein [Kofleriaceae bacterium]|nr:mechanosensitive ion channel family protein [Kofleriaceae bacterium]
MRISEWMPDWLLAMGPGGLAAWQWIGFVAVIGIAWIVGRAGAWAVTWTAAGIAGRTTTSLDDELLGRLRSPLRMLASVGLMRLGVVVLELPADAYKVAVNVLLALFAIALVWGALRSIDVMSAHLSRATWAVERPSARSLLALITRVAKVVVIVIAGIGFMSGIGLPVASLLAGLGIGGIALAFGAQKTVENVFGAVAIGVDRPFREGDFVRVEADTMGTVEAIGLRSTRIRTLDRTVVTLPNGRLADMRIETFALRDRIRFNTMLNLVRETTAAQMREVLAGLEDVLRKHPLIWPDSAEVRFAQLGASSLDVEVIAYFKEKDFGKFKVIRQDVLLQFMEVVERAGSGFAFPTHTVHIAGETGRTNGATTRPEGATTRAHANR